MEELLKRALKLLDKGNIRYSDRLAEEERAKLAQDIADLLAAPRVAENDLQQEVVAEVTAEPEPKKRVYLPVLKGDV
jgi:hypothetical protein